jgi:hypothetical protein
MSTPAVSPRGVLRPPPLVAAIAFAKLSLLLSCASAYGYVAGELVSLACARHLAWGYAAHPPLSIAFLLGVVKLYGESEVTVRVIPAVLSAVVVVLTARLAKRFGAGTLAQGLAALCVVLAPGLLSIDHTYSTRSLAILFSIVVAGLVARALAASAEGATTAWLSVGAAVGLGLENDLTLLVYVGGLGVGLAMAHRLRRGEAWLGWRGPAAALGVAAVLIAPYFAWESTHGWPTRELFVRAIHEGRGAAHPLRFVLRQFEVMLPPSAVLWVAGLWALLRHKRFATYRPLGVAFVVCFLAWAFFSDPASGHVAAMFPVLFAAGAAAIDPWLDARRWAYGAFAGVVFLVGMVLVPLTLPVLPVAKYEAYARRLHLGPSAEVRDTAGALPPRFADMFGWPELVRAVDTVVASLPPEERDEAVILASDAGQAGAIDLFGPALNLPAVISGHGEFWRWGTAGASGKVVVAVGGDEAFLRAHFRSVDLVTVFSHSLAAPSQRHVRIYLCRDGVSPLDVMWPDFKRT